MANTAVAKATIKSTTKDNNVVLPLEIQREVRLLREGRNLSKQADTLTKTARTAILDFLGDVATNLIGTDARGTRLISVKVVESSESFDWERLQKTQPELYSLLKDEYTIPRGAKEPVIRVDLI